MSHHTAEHHPASLVQWGLVHYWTGQPLQFLMNLKLEKSHLDRILGSPGWFSLIASHWSKLQVSTTVNGGSYSTCIWSRKFGCGHIHDLYFPYVHGYSQFPLHRRLQLTTDWPNNGLITPRTFGLISAIVWSISPIDRQNNTLGIYMRCWNHKRIKHHRLYNPNRQYYRGSYSRSISLPPIILTMPKVNGCSQCVLRANL